MQTLNDPRTTNGWALFDWANSAFALVITTAIFPPYFEARTDEMISIGGLETSNSSWLGWTISLSYLLIALASPVLAGIADAGGRRKGFLRAFTTLGGIACLCLFFFEDMDDFWIGTLAFALGMIGFAGGLVFYNSFLPVIASPDRFDRLSARGFAMGYVGSVILLIINLLMVQKPAWFGLPDTTLPARLAFVTVGVWWLGFGYLSLSRLPADERVSGPGLGEMSRRGWAEVKSVWRRVRASRPTLLFLASFFSYSAGVQTVLFLASLFAAKELGFETSELIVVVLILQVVAIAGAYLAAGISKRYGNKVSLFAQLVVWLGICLAGYFVEGKTAFYGVAAAVGLVMGGIQSMSRSTYSKLIPTRDEVTSYFSFYDILEKVAIAGGTFIFALLDSITGSMRISILALSVFFVGGMVFLAFFRLPEGDR